MIKLIKTSLLMLAILFGRDATAQDCYIVMKIKGSILLESTGKALQKDDQVCSSDNVIFKSKDAVAIVHSPTKGRYTLKANKSRISELEGMIVCSLNNALSKSKNTLDTRSGDNPDELDFGDRYCILDTYQLITALKGNEISSDNYFVLSFNLDEKPYEIKVRNEQNTIYLDRDAVMVQEIRQSGQDYIDDVALFLCSNSSPGTRKIIDAFDVSLPDKVKLSEELINYADLLRASGKTDDAIPGELEKYVSDTYGKINKDLFINLINELKILNK